MNSQQLKRYLRLLIKCVNLQLYMEDVIINAFTRDEQELTIDELLNMYERELIVQYENRLVNLQKTY